MIKIESCKSGETYETGMCLFFNRDQNRNQCKVRDKKCV